MLVLLVDWIEPVTFHLFPSSLTIQPTNLIPLVVLFYIYIALVSGEVMQF